MIDNRPATAAEADTGGGGTARASWQWPPSAEDLEDIACVDTAHASLLVRPDAAPSRAGVRPAPAAPRRRPLVSRIHRVHAPIGAAAVCAAALAAAVAGVWPTRSGVGVAPATSVAAGAAKTARAEPPLSPEFSSSPDQSEIERTAAAMSTVAAGSEAVPTPTPRVAALDLTDASATNLRVQPAVSTFAATPDEAGDVAPEGGDSFAAPTRSEAFTDASPPTPIVTQTTAMLPGEVAGAVPLRLDVPRGGVEADDVRLAPERAETAPGLPVPSTIPGDEPAVRAVLQQYGSAYTRLDARAARVVWPSVDGRALARAFEALESQQVVFERCDVFVQGSEARAACRGSATYVPRVGDRRPRTEPRQWTFRLEKAADANWRIASADIRAR